MTDEFCSCLISKSRMTIIQGSIPIVGRFLVSEEAASQKGMESAAACLMDGEF